MGNVVKKSQQPPPPYGNGGKPYRVSDIIEEKKKKKLRILEDEYIRFRIFVKTKTTDEEIYKLLQKEYEIRSKHYLFITGKDIPPEFILMDYNNIKKYFKRYNKEECPKFKIKFVIGEWYNFNLLVRIDKKSFLTLGGIRESHV